MMCSSIVKAAVSTLPVQPEVPENAGPDTLWRHRAFRNLWAAQTTSQFGSQITLVAMPLIAALLLDATAFEMGLLSAAYMLPFLLFGLGAGIVVDRLRHRSILIVTDLLRAVALLSVPVSAMFGILRIETLIAVQFVVGALTLFFDVAYQSYLPAIVRRDQLPEANGKLELSRATARLAGPSVSGAMVGWLSGPIAILLDALTYLGSAGFLLRIPTERRHPETVEADVPVRSAIAAGVREVFHDPFLRATTISITLWNLSDSVIMAVYVLFVTRELGFGAVAVGLIFAAGNVGGLLGSLIAGKVATRIGPGPTIVAGSLAGALGIAIIPLASEPRLLAGTMLISAQVLASLSLLVTSINVVAVRQAITPADVLGRVNATVRFVTWGLLPLGSLLGGTLGTLIGLRPTVAVGAAIAGTSFLCLWRSSVREVRKVPDDDQTHSTSQADV